MTRTAQTERAVAFLRGVTAAGAAVRSSLDDGLMLCSPDESDAYVANQLLLDRPQCHDSSGLAELLDGLQQGQGHRRAHILDDQHGARLHAGLSTRGWGGGAEVLMVLPDEVPLAPTRAATAVSVQRLRAIEASTNFEFGLPQAVAVQLERVRQRAFTAYRGRGFVASEGGSDVAHATLYSDGVTAQIEDVATLKSHRGRGMATAAVTAAASAARDSAHQLVFLVADADDWPRQLYAKLGFVTVTRTWVVQREGVPADTQVSSMRRPPA